MTQARVLMISPRACERQIWRCGQAECEDVIRSVDDVELLEPRALARGGNFAGRHAQRFSERLLNAELKFRSRRQPLSVDGEYELFVMYAAQPTDLDLLALLPDWRERSQKAVCILDEFWVCQLRTYEQWLDKLRDFDLLAVMFYQTVEPLQRRAGVPAIWLPPGIDAVRFFPGVSPPERTIDFFAMGRRSEASHRALREYTQANRQLYLFDTVEPHCVRDSLREHRDQLAELVKRTRYFVANMAKIDVPEHRGVQQELGFRSFEGAAGGAVLLGHTPDVPSLSLLFDWPDAHIHMPFGCTEVARIIADLEADPERVRTIRQNNVLHSVRRHDWAYRWQSILDALSLAPRPALQLRIELLQELALSIADDALTSDAHTQCAQ